MGIRARRKMAVLIPWIALAGVTTLLLWQIASRRGGDGQGTLPSSDAPPALTAATEPDASATATLRAAAQATEKALSEALVDLEAARGETREAARRNRLLQARAEAAEAGKTLAETRIEALEVEVETSAGDVTLAEQARAGFEARIEALEADLAKARDPVLQWFEDAQSEDRARRAGARKAAGKATSDQVSRMSALFAEDPSRAGAVAHLVGGLPASEGRDDLAAAVLLAQDADSEAANRVKAVGAEALSAAPVALSVLGGASNAVVREALGWLAGRELDWSPDDRRALATSLVAPEKLRAVRVRAVGVLKLEGVAPRLVALAFEGEAPIRAAAVHALSRVPDLEQVREVAARGLVKLLDDEDLAVRTAAVLLAEALIGKAVDFDPAAAKAARREARDRILDRLP